jgi:hypothetical protein
MKSFIKEIEDKFLELQETIHEIEDVSVDDLSDSEEIDEQNVTAAVAGYNIPGAFTTPEKFKKKKFKYESVTKSTKPVSKTYKPGHYQTIEFDEEVQNDKFPFAIDDAIWWNKDMEYPSKDITKSPGTAHKKDYDQKTKKLKVEDVLEKKYEQLIEGYRDFKSGDVKPSNKVKSTIQEIAKKLQEIETLVNYNSKLKTESGVTSSAYGPATQKALTKISERLIKISERVRSLGE